MKNFKISITVIILFCFIFINSTNCLACDITHDDNEEYNLYYENLFESPCQDSKYGNANCTKYLIRYDGLTPKIEKISEVVGEIDSIYKTEALEKAGIVTTSMAVLGTGIYFAPITTVLTALGVSLGLPVVCVAYNGIVKPTDKVLGFIFKPIIKMVEYFTGGSTDPDPNIGAIGNAIITMCGDSSRPNSNEGLLEGIRKLIFGKTDIKKSSEQIVYKELLDEFYRQVKKRKFDEKNFEGKSNNFLIFCIDSTDVNNIKHKLKFDRTHLNIGDYPNKTEDYFKDWL